MIKYKIIKLLLLFSLIVYGNLNCVTLPARTPKMKSDIMESNDQLIGKIGFCCIFSYSMLEGEALELLWHFKPEKLARGISYYNLDELQNLFLDIIGNRELIDCNYEKLNDFNRRKSLPRYSHFFNEYRFSYPHGYIMIFDEKDKDGVWVMYQDSLRFLNEFFNCDYYLTGKIYMSYEKESGYEHNLLLVIYNNKGYKVWTKRYRNKYSFDDKIEDRTEKFYPEKIRNIYYENIKTLFNDYKDEINKDLDLILGSRKD